MSMLNQNLPVHPTATAPVSGRAELAHAIPTKQGKWRARFARITSLLLTQTILPLVILAAAILICYYGIWQAYFATRDDFNILGWIMRQPTLWEAIQGYGNGVRFLLFGIVWIRTQWFGLNPAPYFWSGLGQHLLVGFLVYRMVLAWAPDWPNERSGAQSAVRATAQLSALLVALFFVTTFSYYEVVTNISASSYSLRTLLYLPILIFFGAYLRQQRWRDYLIALICYLLLVFMADYALSIPLILLAYQYTLGKATLQRWLPRWQDLRLHLPFWLLWTIHVALQLGFLHNGSSEAIYSEAAYTPGLHMISNLRYLVFLIVPNVHMAPIQNFLTPLIGSGAVNLIWQFTIALAIVAHGIAVVALWRGTAFVRFALALIYLPFLQYTLWQDGFADAPRYLYLSAIGYSILVISALLFGYQWLAHCKFPRLRFVVPTVLAGVLLANILFAQIWIRQQIANGEFRRAVVEELAERFQNLPPHAQIYIEIPEQKYEDLALSCYFALKENVTCETVLHEEDTLPTNAAPSRRKMRSYWLPLLGASAN